MDEKQEGGGTERTAQRHLWAWGQGEACWHMACHKHIQDMFNIHDMFVSHPRTSPGLRPT